MRAQVDSKTDFYKIFILLLWAWSLQGLAQLPSSEFSVAAIVCMNEQLSLSNSSQEAENHLWDFCEGDLYEAPTASIVTTLTTALNPKEMHLVRDGSHWYGFVTSRTNNSLIRLNFGTDLTNPSPTVINLGNVGNLLSGPEQIKLLKEEDHWYGLLVNGTTGTLVRLSFGTSLDVVPTGEVILANVSAANGGMDIGVANDQVVACITNASTQVLSIINFGPTVQNNPTSADQLTVSIPGASQLEDVTLLHIKGIWYGFAIGSGSRTIHRLNFGTSLFSVPTITNITAPSFSTDERPFGIRIAVDMGRFVGYVQTFAGSLFRLDFGISITNTSPESFALGNLGMLANSVNFELLKNNSNWHAFVVNQTTRVITRLDFPNNCSTNQPTSSDFEPYGVEYNAPGTYHISLTVSDQNNNCDYSSASITVSGNQSPDINFNSQNSCANHNVEFNSLNSSSNIVSYDWDFGDTNISSLTNPTHVYTTAGEYTVQLNVLADNGCSNLVRQSVEIFNQPIVDFQLPANNPVCTNRAYDLVNNTVFDEGSSPAWQWIVNDIVVSFSKKHELTFTDAVPQKIELHASIPGCSSSVTKALTNLVEGPLVNFSFNGQCEEEKITFAAQFLFTPNPKPISPSPCRHSPATDHQHSLLTSRPIHSTAIWLGGFGIWAIMRAYRLHETRCMPIVRLATIRSRSLRSPTSDAKARFRKLFPSHRHRRQRSAQTRFASTSPLRLRIDPRVLFSRAPGKLRMPPLPIRLLTIGSHQPAVRQ
jgi:PKD repeat protein